MPGIVKYINRYAVVLFTTASCCAATALYGQSQRPLIQYSTENGLSLNSVNDLHFDRQGFLWITTADGLQRFDGYRFQTFKHDAQDKKSIAENSVSEIYEDADGNLWITHRTGICFKPKGKNEFIDLSSAIVASLPFRYPLFCVNETDTAVWVINYPYGVFEVNKTSLHVKKLFPFPGTFHASTIYILSRVRSKGDKLWFREGQEKSSDLYQVTGSGIKQFSNPEKIKVHFLIPCGKDSLVIVSDNRLYKALAKDPFTPVKVLRSPPDAGDLNTRYAVLPRKIANDQYLLPGIHKIWLYDARKETLTVFPHDEYFPGDMIRYFNTATADHHQNNWLGYNGIGGIKVISLQKFNGFSRPVKNALTYTLATDDRGKIFAGIYFGDIEVYDKEGKFIQKIELPGQHKKFGSPRAMAMIDSITLIVKSTLQELYGVDTRTGKLQLLSHLLPRTDSVFRVFELGMQKIRDGEIWFSYNNSILSIRKDKTGFSSSPICTLPEKDLITSFFNDGSGRIFIGTLTGVWSYENNDFQKIPLPQTYIKHINRSPDGSIWLATTDGLYILKDNKMTRHLNTKDGLPNSFVYSVLFDEEGNAWISTNRGLAKIDPSFRVTSYSGREGLQGDEFNTKGYCKGADGTLYFAGVNGINFFKPRNLVSKGEPSRTMLTQLLVNNQPYLPNQQPEFFNTLRLDHRQNNLSLSFSYMDFTVPEKNQYKFRLKGSQADWTLPQTNNTVQYILPPGEYQLYVLGANYEGVWSKEPLVLKIHILPPWYQTSWARIIFALLVLAAVGGIFYFISRNRYQKKLRQLQLGQQVQKEKERLSRDLHDNLGAQVSWLSNNIQQLQMAQEGEQPVEQKINRLKEGAGELMQTLRETIWILNKDKISAIDFFDKLVSHAARYLDAFPAIRLQTEERIDTNLQLNSGQALQLFRICQEAIANVCKHAGASVLILSAHSTNDIFSITIRDNGKGFNSNAGNPSGHYGLQNMKQRAEEANLVFTIDSSPGKGTGITVSVAH